MRTVGKRVVGLAVALALPSVACAETFTFGPIIGRGLKPDTMIVKWGTDTSGTASTVYLRKKGDTAFTTVAASTGRDHEAWLKSLAAGTVYEYYVETGAQKSATKTFSTCPVAGLPMDFVFYGDSRSGPTAHAQVVTQLQKRAPEMVFESGDIAPTGMSGEYEGEFFSVAKEIASSISFMAAPGNHDALGGLATTYSRYFPTPRADGAAWAPYYTFTCGNGQFISLNSNDVYDVDQQSFLEKTLSAVRANRTVQHVFVWFHHSAYSPGSHGDSSQVQAKWVPLFNDPANKVTAVFSGHDHIYARMKDASSVFYVVSGGAGAGLYSDTKASKATKVVSKSTYNFVSVHLAGLQASFTAYDEKGTELDRFAITKTEMAPPDGGPPVEEMPDLGTPPDEASSPAPDAGVTEMMMGPDGCAMMPVAAASASGSLAGTGILGMAGIFAVVRSRRRPRR